MTIRNVISCLALLGYPIEGATEPAMLFNDNDVCVQWSQNMTMKRNRHMQQRESSVRESETGPSPRSLHLSFALTLCVYWSAWPWNSGAR